MSNLAPFFPFDLFGTIFSESSKGGGQPPFWKGLQLKAVTNVECSKRNEVLKPQIMLGYPTSVVEGVGDEFISVRENLIS